MLVCKKGIYFIPPFFIYLVLSLHYDLELVVREKQACVSASDWVMSTTETRPRCSY